MGADWRGNGEGLVEDDMSGDQQAVRGEIEEPIPLMLRGVAEEDKPIGVWGKLMGSGGRKVGIAGAPEDPKVGIRGSGAEEGKVR